ncbi:MAG: Holliday junction resolvase RecU [Epulopiscium sp. Nuni2H_MBin003]|nr:MAG: Holliday junction resolvase RecU [Epulopiscium sp. Nuni2H_MBin003]
MAYWQSRGLRGSELEEIINLTNDMYRTKNIALIQKVPTPITPISIDKQKKVITLAYFDQKSTVDYIGVAQGIAICFDAKQTASTSLPLANIHQHQIDFMDDFISQGGVSFIIVHFKKVDEYYLVPFEILGTYFRNAQKGGRKSIPYKEFENAYKIEIEANIYLHYIKALQKYIDECEIV